MNEFNISDFVAIKNNTIFKNGKKIYSVSKEIDFHQFVKKAYVNEKMAYPKFHKMDSLSKLGILASTILFKDYDIPTTTALVLSNYSSSLESDEAHEKSLTKTVSPAVFVYTLPNIVLGEISIKHQITGEQIFFISDGFDSELIHSYSSLLLNSSKTNKVVCGWIEWKNADYDVFLCLISKEGEIIFSEKQLAALYHFEYE